MVRSMMSVAALALALNMAGPALAKKAAAKAMTCPVCHMALSTKKTKANPTMVKLGGKTYYCCSKCDMSSLKGGAKTGGAKMGGTKMEGGAK